MKFHYKSKFYYKKTDFTTKFIFHHKTKFLILHLIKKKLIFNHKTIFYLENQKSPQNFNITTNLNFHYKNKFLHKIKFSSKKRIHLKIKFLLQKHISPQKYKFIFHHILNKIFPSRTKIHHIIPISTQNENSTQNSILT